MSYNIFKNMKIYQRPETPRIRIDAKRGSEKETIYLEGCTLLEATEFVRGLLLKRGSPIAEGMRTSVVLREYIDKHGASKSVSSYGVAPSEVIDLIKEELDS